MPQKLATQYSLGGHCQLLPGAPGSARLQPGPVVTPAGL